jgi:(E)-4-hydroxy-3-methylbut-2-enyl-diphosphate synthase
MSTSQKPAYCQSYTTYKRRPTIDVNIGTLTMGSRHPIRVQSMTTTNTLDVEATIAQSIRMIEAGCELVRITAPSIREAKALEFIRTGLRERGFTVPLVADIHYTPNAAEVAARFVEKVRINPGNYVDKKQFATLEYSQAEYAAEIDRIRNKFVPLLRICKEHGTAMRIGTNHGSLSDRIMSRYGDNPTGMVESALEFLRIAEDEGYYNIVLSMKSSNPLIMVEAYRLLVVRLAEEGLKPYPLHLGVTEAGDGEDGRVKSALGIGTLLEDGLGDTIRVSLTEEPEAEIPVAQSLARRYENRTSTEPSRSIAALPYSPYAYQRRSTRAVANVGADFPPRVFANVSHQAITNPLQLAAVGHTYDSATDKWATTDQGCDHIYVGSAPLPFMAPAGTRQVLDYDAWLQLHDKFFSVPLHTHEGFVGGNERHSVMNVVRVLAEDLTNEHIAALDVPGVIVLMSTEYQHAMPTMRAALVLLAEAGCATPVVFDRSYHHLDAETAVLHASTDVGGLFVDGLGDGVMVSVGDVAASNRLAFGILQAARTRMTKTEYISCPSCGRTLFDLQETTALIRQHTDHLKGIKIGIMGCIVNGPGEMADADYGYVGSGPERITLYRGQNIVRRNVPTAEALDALVGIMKEDGVWLERTGA